MTKLNHGTWISKILPRVLEALIGILFTRTRFQSRVLLLRVLFFPDARTYWRKRDREREKKREKGTIPLSKSFAFFIAFSHFFVTRLISFEYIYAERGESLEYHIKQPSYSNRSSHYPLLQVMFNTFNFDIFIRSIFETCSY